MLAFAVMESGEIDTLDLCLDGLELYEAFEGGINQAGPF
jgi:hypothetical protein